MDTAPAFGPEVFIIAAVERKLTDIACYAEQLQGAHLSHNGRLYYADRASLSTITTTLSVVQMMADTDPVPTPPPVAGYWLSADRDQSGARVLVPMNAGQFKQLARALYDRNAALWGASRCISPPSRPWPRPDPRRSRSLDMITRPAGRKPER